MTRAPLGVRFYGVRGAVGVQDLECLQFAALPQKMRCWREFRPRGPALAPSLPGHAPGDPREGVGLGSLLCPITKAGGIPSGVY